MMIDMAEAKEWLIEVSLRQVLLFYQKHKDIFVSFSNQKEKREIIKKIYKELGYDLLPQINTEIKAETVEGSVVYRGISASSKEELLCYIYQFMKGEVFYGGRASIYGTGIYTVEDENVARKYATDGDTNNIGIAIESVLRGNSIIDNESINEIRDIVFERIRKAYKNMNNYLEILEDNGALAAILGYDAIRVNEKGYIVVLNRTKLIVNDMYIYHELNRLDREKSR